MILPSDCGLHPFTGKRRGSRTNERTSAKITSVHWAKANWITLAVALLCTSHSALAHEPATGRDCSGYSYTLAFASAPPNYTPRYHTVAHAFLDAERGIGPVTSSEYAILDAVINEAKSRLEPVPAGLDDAAYRQFAVDSLKTIDCILVSHGFVYPASGWSSS